MFLTKKHLSRRTLLKGAGVSLALPLLDAMIPAATALSQTAAARKLRMGFFYIPHGAIMGNTSHGREDGQVDSQRRGRGLQAQSHHEVAGTLQELRDLVRKPEERGHGGRRAQPRSRNLAERREAGRQGARSQACPRLWIRSLPATSVRARRCRRWNWLPRRRFRWLPAAALDATTAPRCLSATPLRRCRWNSIRARSSSSCLAKATPTRNAMPFPGRTPAFWIASMSAPGHCSANWIRATAPFWTAI